MDKVWLIPLVIFLLGLTGTFLIILIKIVFLDPMQDKWDKEREKCDNIEGCERYSCYAELPPPSTIHLRNYFLLQEQNCLLKQTQNYAKASEVKNG